MVVLGLMLQKCIFQDRLGVFLETVQTHLALAEFAGQETLVRRANVLEDTQVFITDHHVPDLGVSIRPVLDMQGIGNARQGQDIVNDLLVK